MPEILAQFITPVIAALSTPKGAASGVLGALLGLVQMWRMRQSRKTAGDWMLHLLMAGIAAVCAAVVAFQISAMPLPNGCQCAPPSMLYSRA